MNFKSIYDQFPSYLTTEDSEYELELEEFYRKKSSLESRQATLMVRKNKAATASFNKSSNNNNIKTGDSSTVGGSDENTNNNILGAAASTTNNASQGGLKNSSNAAALKEVGTGDRESAAEKLPPNNLDESSTVPEGPPPDLEDSYNSLDLEPEHRHLRQEQMEELLKCGLNTTEVTAEAEKNQSKLCLKNQGTFNCRMHKCQKVLILLLLLLLLCRNRNVPIPVQQPLVETSSRQLLAYFPLGMLFEFCGARPTDRPILTPFIIKTAYRGVSLRIIITDINPSQHYLKDRRLSRSLSSSAKTLS